QASDFFGIYQAGSNLNHGYSIYDSQDYLHEAPPVVPFYYFYRYLPPTAYGAAAIASVLPPYPAYWAWVAFNELLLALVVLSILRSPRWPARRRWIAASLWLGFFPIYIEQVMGQFSLTMAVLLWIIWRADLGSESGAGSRLKSWSGRVAWALSLTLKTYPVLLTCSYLRDRRLRRILAGFGLAAALCLPYFLFRPADLHEFARLNLSPFTPDIYKGSFGLQTFLRDLLMHLPGDWNTPLVHIAGRGLSAGSVVLLGTSLSVAGLALLAVLRLKPAGVERSDALRHALDLAIWVTVFFLVFKSVWEYHYVMILPVVSALYLTCGSRTVLITGLILGLPTLFGVAPLLTGAAPTAPLAAWPGWFRILHFSVKCIPTLVLFGWCLQASRLPHARSTAALNARM
ncbi:MAG: glycosyltransferase 87 family protein, partial [Candidatus Eisenbacteria bacterium]